MTRGNAADQAIGRASIRMVPGDVAPRYDGTGEIEAHGVVLDHIAITEQATTANLPIVDFVAHDADGRVVVLTLTGRIVNAIAAAVKGANLRNHGTPEP